MSNISTTLPTIADVHQYLADRGLGPDALSDPQVQLKLGNRPKRIYSRQEAYLIAYAQTGTGSHAIRAAGVSDETARRWQTMDTLHFKARLHDARERFADSLEELALDRVRNPEGKVGSDVLLIALLNANKPSKYRPQQSINISVEESRQSWAALRSAVRQASEPQALPAPATTTSEDD